MKPAFEFSQDGYVAGILTWGMSSYERRSYLSNLQNGCPMWWKFCFKFIWTLGGWRNDRALEQIQTGNRVPSTAEKVFERMDEFFDTPIGSIVGKTLKYAFFGALGLLVLAVGTAILSAVVGLLYWLYLAATVGGEAAIGLLGLVIALAIIAAMITAGVFLVKGLHAIGRYVAKTDAWKLIVMHVKSVHEKTCPLVGFVEPAPLEDP